MNGAAVVTLDDLTVPAPPRGPADWNDDGVVILPGFADDTLIDAYKAEWWGAHGPGGERSLTMSVPPGGEYAGPWILDAVRPGGWPDTCPYMRHDALRRLCCDGRLADVLEDLIGEPAGVNLNLTGWVSTERDWHQDSYLNESEVGDRYAAVWVALGDIHPDSGPFQYVPGSHRWPQVTRDRIGAHFDLGDPSWPKQSETLLTPLFTRESERRGAEVVTHLPRRGDVLVWHGRLLHRGSRPRVRGACRPALIAHYSGIHHRPQMPAAVRHEAGGWYFPLITDHPVA